jgi:hypothetical protein
MIITGKAKMRIIMKMTVIGYPLPMVLAFLTNRFVASIES